MNDNVLTLTETPDSKEYSLKMQNQKPAMSEGSRLSIPPLSNPTEGCQEELGCANTKGILRIIQNFFHLKADPFNKSIICPLTHQIE